MQYKFQPGDLVRIVNYPALASGAAKYYKKEYEVQVLTSRDWWSGGRNAYVLKDVPGFFWKEDWLELVEPVTEITENDIDSVFGE